MAAVEVRGGYKYYGGANNPNKNVILNYLDMKVDYGSIYGLLGASGCGKTTLLSCIVGVKKLNAGQIYALGRPPGPPGSAIPGPRIGYMPQDIALVEEFTVKESIYYFGRIYGMTDNSIRERYKLLYNLLELPAHDRFLKNCSGGQQRRVSFAAAMVHEPELLILDEPTVGLDPILREKIWDFLVETTRTTKLAVIITTHYIEEANQAHKIGLMRGGILLAEDTPQRILSAFGTSTLEEAFLILSAKQGLSEKANVSLQKIESNQHHPQHRQSAALHNRGSIDGEDMNTNTIKVDTSKLNGREKKQHFPKPLKRNVSFQEQRPPGLKGKLQLTSKIRMKALLTKNVLQLIRQPTGIIFCFLFPILQLACFYLAIGANPKNLKIGIVNEEISSYDDCYNSSYTLVRGNRNDYTCDMAKISCRFIDRMDPTIMNKVFFNNVDDAYAAARKTDLIGYMHFKPNFTESVQMLIDDGRGMNEYQLKSTELVIRLDMSDQQVAFLFERKLRKNYKEFAEDLMVDCGYPRRLGSVPVNFLEPIYGDFEAEYQSFMAPGIIMTMIFFLATLVTSTIFITDRLDGVWDRTLIAGISIEELLFAHIFTQSIIMFIQCLEVVSFAAFFFQSENKGDNSTVVGLLTLIGFAGMLYGLLISIYCDSHTQANFVATGSFYPMIILCGLLWPLESMPKFLRYFSMLLPFTIPSVSMRNVLLKGWSIAHFEVWEGFGVVFIWIFLLFSLCMLGLKAKK